MGEKMYIQVTPEQKAKLDELVSKGKRFALVFGKNGKILSIHSSYKAASETARNYQIFGESAMKGANFIDAYDWGIEQEQEIQSSQICEVIAEPVIHPAFNWVANKIWGEECDYEDCTGDQRKLIDLAKVNEHSNIDLSYQDLSHLRLGKAVLDGADLRCAKLLRANLEDANLEKANLEGSNLLWADVWGAKLRGAHISVGYVLTERLPYYISNVGSDEGVLELYKCESGWWYVKRGCFSGSLPEFLAAVEKKHGDNEHGRKYRAIVAALCD